MNAASLPGFSSPGASTEAPLEMLAACHGRVDKQCRTLQRLAVHLLAHGSDLQAQQAATAVMRYFDTAARDHHADEEQDLFPALLATVHEGEAAPVRELIGGLLAEHRALEQRWERIRPLLAAVAQGQAVALAPEQVADFVSAYERHIEREDGELLPLAARLLAEQDISRIGRAMRERRGIAAV